MTTTQYLPKWLRSLLKRASPQRTARRSKKDRQVLPALPNPARSSTAFQDDESPAGFRTQWRL